MTEPVPPFEVRLIRENKGAVVPDVSIECDFFLNMEIYQSFIKQRISEIVVDWDARIDARGRKGEGCAW